MGGLYGAIFKAIKGSSDKNKERRAQRESEERRQGLSAPTVARQTVSYQSASGTGPLATGLHDERAQPQTAAPAQAPPMTPASTAYNPQAPYGASTTDPSRGAFRAPAYSPYRGYR